MEPAADILFPDTKLDAVTMQSQIDALKKQVDALQKQAGGSRAEFLISEN